MNNPAQKSYQLYIGGEWVDASDGGTLDVYCPANGEQLSVIADATKEDVDRAVDAAWEAFETWSKTTKAERAIILNKVADLIEDVYKRQAYLSASAAASMSFSTARVRPHTVAWSPASSAMRRTDSKSPGLEMGKPASMTSTLSRRS